MDNFYLKIKKTETAPIYTKEESHAPDTINTSSNIYFDIIRTPDEHLLIFDGRQHIKQ